MKARSDFDAEGILKYAEYGGWGYLTGKQLNMKTVILDGYYGYTPS